jgi:hypothetical protein
MNNGGLFGGNNGWGGGILGFLLGLFFGNGWGGFGGFGGGWGGNNGAGFISNQIDNNAGRELLMNAINSNGEASRSAIQNLATMLGQDYNQVSAAVAALQSGLSNLALQQAVSVPQLINSIQSGNATLMSKLCDCCCENRLLTTQQGYESRIATIEQTNTLAGAITGSGQRTADSIADLKTTMVKEFCDARERDMQEKIDSLLTANSTLRSQIDNAAQTQAFASMLAPINAKLIEIENRQPNTIPVQYPNVVAMNATPYAGFGAGYGYGYGVPGGSYWG